MLGHLKQKNAGERHLANMNTLQEVRDKLKLLHDKLGTWRSVSKAIGIPAGTLNSIWKEGREPKNKTHRRILGLPALGEAPICPTCGIIHTKGCPEKEKAKRRKDLLAYPTNELRMMLKNREEVPPPPTEEG